MIRSSCVYSILGVLALAISPARLSAQLDNRVNQGNTATAGRALDSNPGIGTSGFNLTRPGMFDAGAQSNAIITGNVTGLSYFHGGTPVINNNQFREALPTSSLSGFRSQSVGLSDVLGNRVQSGGFFFDRTQTVTDAGYVRAGLNQPGSSFVSTPNTAPPQNFTSDDSSAYLLQRLPDQSDRRVSITRPEFQAGITQTPIDGSVKSKTTAIDIAPYKSAVSSSIFGTPTPSDRPLLMGGGLTLDRSGDDDELSYLATKPLVDDPGLRRLDSQIPSDLSSQDKLTGADTPQPDAGSDVFTMSQSGIASAKPMSAPAFPLEQPSNLGQDRFADIYNAVGVANTLGIKNLGFELKEGESEELQSDPTKARIPGSLMRETTEGIKQLSESARWASDVIEEPLKTFAGKYRNKLNDYMIAGEDELHRGQYYSAARYFELACSIDPMNPLPLLSRGHALAAAGDYRSAVRFLTLGIERFPQIAAFRIDLPALLGRPDVFDMRRADLEDKLSHSENRELRFLLGYLELYSGLPEEGIKNLRIAAKASPPDSVIGMFVELITGLRELPTLGK